MPVSVSSRHASLQIGASVRPGGYEPDDGLRMNWSVMRDPPRHGGGYTSLEFVNAMALIAIYHNYDAARLAGAC